MKQQRSGGPLVIIFLIFIFILLMSYGILSIYSKRVTWDALHSFAQASQLLTRPGATATLFSPTKSKPRHSTKATSTASALKPTQRTISPTFTPTFESIDRLAYGNPPAGFAIWEQNPEDMVLRSNAFRFFYDTRTWRLLKDNTLEHRRYACQWSFTTPMEYFYSVWGQDFIVSGYTFYLIMVPRDHDWEETHRWTLVIVGPHLDQSGLSDVSKPFEGVSLTFWNFRMHLEVAPDDIRPCLQDVFDVLSTLRVSPQYAIHPCTVLEKASWEPGQTMAIPRPVQLLREPRWAPEAWITTLPVGTSITILDEPLCVVQPHNFDFAWPVKAGTQRGWIYQTDLSRGITPKPRELKTEYDGPIPKRLCGPRSLATIFRPGMQGHVCVRNGSLRLRAGPGYDKGIIGNLLWGQPFTILEGPTCIGSNTWWRIRLNDGTTGWVLDGADEEDPRYICPQR